MNVAVEQRVQPTVLLLRGPGQSDDLRVAGVRRLVAEGERCKRRGAEDLVHQTQLQLAEPLTAKLGVEMGSPEAPLLDALLQWGDDLHHVFKREVKDLHRPDLLLDQSPHPVKLCLKLRVCREVPRHR